MCAHLPRAATSELNARNCPDPCAPNSVERLKAPKREKGNVAFRPVGTTHIADGGSNHPRATKNENAELAKADSALFVCLCGLPSAGGRSGRETSKAKPGRHLFFEI